MTRKLLSAFLIAICLFGLASFTAEQRTKEIGVRKTLGASVTSLIILMSKDFTKWVLISNIIALPIAYYLMNGWLQEFAYRINIGFGAFAFSALLSLVIAALTVFYQSLKAAVAKRVDTDLPVGVIYSGGIDSSVVLNEAVKHHGEVTAFTIGTWGSEDFEVSRRYCRERNIRQVIIPLEHRDIRPETIRRAIEVTELNEYLDIINAVISLPLFARIHQEGIKVVLGGD